MDLDIDLQNQRFCIFGLQGSGKSVLVKTILQGEKNSIVYDVLKEHQGFNRYLATHRQRSDAAIDELNMFVNQVVSGSHQIRLFILEEANRYCPPKPTPLPDSILDLNDFQRHQKIAFGLVCRRPTQMHSDLVELAHYLFIYRLVGKNDCAYLEAIAEGLGEAARELEDYHFLVVTPGRKYYVHKPVTDLTKKEGEAISGQS